jgi:hypothetical protein
MASAPKIVKDLFQWWLITIYIAVALWQSNLSANQHRVSGIVRQPLKPWRFTKASRIQCHRILQVDPSSRSAANSLNSLNLATPPMKLGCV